MWNARRREPDGGVRVIPGWPRAVVVIDMWNGYPCCTGRGLFAALVPRMNRALAARAPR